MLRAVPIFILLISAVLATAFSTLATAAGPLRVSGSVLLDMGSGEAYDPSRFQLTTENRFVYQLDKALGIRAVSDPDGNTLTFSSVGISSRGST